MRRNFRIGAPIDFSGYPVKYSNFPHNNQSTGLLFWQASTLWQRQIRETLKPFNLTHTQFVLLAVIEELSEHEGCVTQKMISDFSMIDAMTVSATLRLLERKKLVERTAHKTDTRAKSLLNTERGAAVLMQAVHAVEKTDCDFFFADSHITQHFQQLMKILIKKAGD